MPVQRLQERRRWLNRGFRRAVDAAIERKADFFLQCGDLFDMVDPRNAERTYVAEQLARLREAGVEVLAIGGNHDSPRQTTEHGMFRAVDQYVRLGGLVLFDEPAEATGELDYRLYERDGMRLAIGGLPWNPLTSFGEDPLAGKVFPDPPEGRADWNLLIAHSNLEGHSFPGALEPIIKRQTVSELNVNLLLLGHVHTRTHLQIGQVQVLVPGATERNFLEEFQHDPGFLVVELEHGKVMRHEWVTHPAQPRCRIRVTGNELIPRPVGLRPIEQSPTDVLLQRVEEQRDGDCLTQLELSGRLPRDVYEQLDLARVQEAGNAGCFFFEIDTTELEVENSLGESSQRGIRLSQEEELRLAAQDMWNDAVSEEERRLIEAALGRVLGFYHQGSQGR